MGRAIGVGLVVDPQMVGESGPDRSEDRPLRGEFERVGIEVTAGVRVWGSGSRSCHRRSCGRNCARRRCRRR